jgi:hypothetical protein
MIKERELRIVGYVSQLLTARHTTVNLYAYSRCSITMGLDMCYSSVIEQTLEKIGDTKRTNMDSNLSISKI